VREKRMSPAGTRENKYEQIDGGEDGGG